MNDLLAVAQKVAAVLKERRETIAVAESSTGGLVSAALLSVPGASAYFIGGAVVYTVKARRAMLEIPDAAFAGMRGLTEDAALVFARAARDRFSVTWSIGEIGASGPTGSRYGDPPGRSCIAIAGPAERAVTVETGSADRLGNMRAFAAAALDLLMKGMASLPPAARS
jgi:nicotinamide-nucleotide amidase